MSFYIKLLGAVLIIFSCTLLGFYKAQNLYENEKRVSEILLSLKGLRDKIRLNYGEMNQIISMCFSTDILKIQNGSIVYNQNITTADRNTLKEYFSSVGMGDIESEVKRTEIYIEHFSARLAEEKKKSSDLCRLYRSLGVLCGLFLSIFLI